MPSYRPCTREPFASRRKCRGSKNASRSSRDIISINNSIDTEGTEVSETSTEDSNERPLPSQKVPSHRLPKTSLGDLCDDQVRIIEPPAFEVQIIEPAYDYESFHNRTQKGAPGFVSRMFACAAAPEDPQENRKNISPPPKEVTLLPSKKIETDYFKAMARKLQQNNFVTAIKQQIDGAMQGSQKLELKMGLGGRKDDVNNIPTEIDLRDNSIAAVYNVESQDTYMDSNTGSSSVTSFQFVKTVGLLQAEKSRQEVLHSINRDPPSCQDLVHSNSQDDKESGFEPVFVEYGPAFPGAVSISAGIDTVEVTTADGGPSDDALYSRINSTDPPGNSCFNSVDPPGNSSFVDEATSEAQKTREEEVVVNSPDDAPGMICVTISLDTGDLVSRLPLQETTPARSDAGIVDSSLDSQTSADQMLTPKKATPDSFKQAARPSVSKEVTVNTTIEPCNSVEDVCEWRCNGGSFAFVSDRLYQAQLQSTWKHLKEIGIEWQKTTAPIMGNVTDVTGKEVSAPRELKSMRTIKQNTGVRIRHY